MATQTQVARLAPVQERKVGRSLTELALLRLRRDKLTLAAIAIIVVMVALAAGAPAISQYILHVDPTRTNVTQSYLVPGSPGHVLGTDDLGRDHLARLLYAGGVSLQIAFFAALLSLVLGIGVGMIMGYFGGVVDDAFTWFISTLNSIPSLFLLLIVSAVLNPSAQTLILVLGLLGWTGTARLVRGQTLALREREFVIGAQAVGASPARIMMAHILPNLFSIIIVTLMLDIGSLILVEAALSYLGLGVKPPTPTWGNMLTDAQTYFTKGWHLVIMPGVLIFVTVLCLFIIGDGLRDAFDPTSKD
ncbi:MAG: ABC transporter permease [Anaerolineae bacterium]|nr:ABC transporter permease [Anaerolineae bacterium]